MRNKKENNKIFKVRDKITGKYWNGDRTPTFSDNGQAWITLFRLDSAINSHIRFSYRRANTTLDKMVIPKNWEIVEIALIEEIKSTLPIDKTIKNALIRRELESNSYKLSYFYDKMVSLDVADKIEFIFDLKPLTGKRWTDMECIKEARSQLRLLGVKTRTYRESRGIFGMLDRDQAMKARLVLEVNEIVDLGEIRNKVNNQLAI